MCGCRMRKANRFAPKSYWTNIRSKWIKTRGPQCPLKNTMDGAHAFPWPKQWQCGAKVPSKSILLGPVLRQQLFVFSDWPAAICEKIEQYILLKCWCWYVVFFCFLPEFYSIYRWWMSWQKGATSTQQHRLRIYSLGVLRGKNIWIHLTAPLDWRWCIFEDLWSSPAHRQAVGLMPICLPM